MEEQEPIKIEIPIEEESPPFVPEKEERDVKGAVSGAAASAGKKVASTTAKAAKRAWDSKPRRKVTRGVARGATAVAAKSSRVVQEKVVQTAERQARERVTAAQTRIQETDWKAEAKKGSVRGLRWLSQRLAQWAEKLSARSAVKEEVVEEEGTGD